MAKKRKKGSAKPRKPVSPPQTATESRLLALLAVIAGASALWSAFQWNELLTLRSGGEIFCASGDSASCAALADSSFAVAVQRLTGLPIAGWGLVWSGAALALPVGAWLRGTSDGNDEPFWTGTLLAAAAGVASVLLLLTVSLSEGGLCANCVITYAIVVAYAAVCWLRHARRTMVAKLQPGSGAGVATLVTGIGFLALLYPGLQTPFPSDQQAQEAVSRALESHAGHDHASHDEHDHASHDEHDHATRGGGQSIDPGAAKADNLVQLIAWMDPAMRQAFADSLAIYTASSADGVHPPRALRGSPDAPVRITAFTDTLCGHCAQLHATLARMYADLPAGSFSIDSRHFPLDGNCNPNISQRPEDPVRCVSASAQICMEGDPNAFRFAGTLYENQRDLDSDRVYQLASPYIDRATLEACVAAPETQAKLQADIAWALEHDIRGTPLVLINGRRASAFGPFLYAMVTTQGRSEHAAFSALPPPSPPSH